MPCCVCRPSKLTVSAGAEVIPIPDSDATTSDSEDGSEYSASDAKLMEGVGQYHPEQTLNGRQGPPLCHADMLHLI